MKKPVDELEPLVKQHLSDAGVLVEDDEKLRRIIEMYKVRFKTLDEFIAKTKCFFSDDLTYDEKGKKKFLDKEGNKDNLNEFADRLVDLDEFTYEEIEKVCRVIAEERDLKASGIIHPTRMAISGTTDGAGLFEMMEVIGKDKVIDRMRKAISL